VLVLSPVLQFVLLGQVVIHQIHVVVCVVIISLLVKLQPEAIQSLYQEVVRYQEVFLLQSLALNHKFLQDSLPVHLCLALKVVLYLEVFLVLQTQSHNLKLVQEAEVSLNLKVVLDLVLLLKMLQLNQKVVLDLVLLLKVLQLNLSVQLDLALIHQMVQFNQQVVLFRDHLIVNLLKVEQEVHLVLVDLLLDLEAQLQLQSRKQELHQRHEMILQTHSV